MANEKTLKESLLAASPFLIKILEIILVVICIALIWTPYGGKIQPSYGRVGYVYSVYVGAIIVDCLIIASHYLGERMQKKTCTLIAALYGTLLLIAAILIIYDWKNTITTIYIRPTKHHMDLMLASGIFAVLSSAAFYTDLGLTIVYG